ncbi:MAG TPA: DUF411 domain-containing protein [Magnetospirillum sp.]|jgi:hypothetical protein|nr:DUF411 domain-containing protein [Magnetospirillum sp.]
MKKFLPALALAAWAVPALAAEQFTVYKAASCGCCTGWVEYMKAKGHDAKVVTMDDVTPIKQRHHVPEAVQSCHTAVIDGYVIEGHVPVEAVDRLLAERPKVTGIAAPGMPQGSPGMSGPKEPFTVYSFGPDGYKPFMRF